MGCESSVPVLEVHLSPLSHPVAAIDPRYCARGFLTLEAKNRFIQVGTFYEDVHTKSERFAVTSKLLSSRQMLVDCSTDTPIANYKPMTLSFQPIMYVRHGSETNGAELFQIYARYRYSRTSEVRVAFRDVMSGLPCMLGFEGHWRRRSGFFWLDRGRDGVREAVARVHTPSGCSYRHAHIVVTPNMDAALIVMVCDILRADQVRAEQRS